MKKILLGFIEDGKSGGVDNYILHFLDAVWREGMQIDLLTNQVDSTLQEQLKKYHSRLFAVANLRHPLKQFRQVRYLIRREGYEMVYLNISTSMDLIAAFAAKFCQVPRRILHSHSSGNDCESAKKRAVFNLLQRICRRVIYRAANEFYACSRAAGYWMYPARIVNSKDFHIIYNAVDMERFHYHPQTREQIRQDMGLKGKLVVGHVSNFCYSKNLKFLIRVFAELHRKCPEAVLMLVGTGSHYEAVREQVEKEGLGNSVRFLGWRNDVDRLLQAMDVFLLPSHFEGLPTVCIEAQCTGLPCVISDAVTRETAISDRCDFVSLKETPDYWANKILLWKNQDREQISFLENIRFYSLEDQKKRLEKLVCGGNYE